MEGLHAPFVPAPGCGACALSVAVAGCGRETGGARTAVAADSTQVLRQRIVALEAARSFGAGELERDLRHPDARVRRAAAVALGRIQDRAALGWLLPVLSDADSNVAVQAAFAVGQLQGLQEADRHALQAVLIPMVDNHPTLHNAPFVEALGKQGGPEVAPVLEQSLASGVYAAMGSAARPPFLEGVAAWGLARLHTSQARRFLADVGDLRSRTGPAAWRIAAAMAADPDTAYMRPLLTLLDHPDKFARAAGARALGKQHDPRAVAPLVQHLSDLDWQVRASILLALAELSDRKRPEPQAAEFAAALLTDSHPLVREAAATALDSLGVGTHGALLQAALADRVPAVRLAATRAACRAGGAQARAAFEAARNDSVPFVRSQVLDATHWVYTPDAAADLLLACLASDVVQDRIQAASALGDLPGLHAAKRTAARHALETALGDADFVVAASAAEALGKLGGRESLPALTAAYGARLQGHNDVDVRLAVLEAVDASLPKQPGSEWNAGRALLDARRDRYGRARRARCGVGLARFANTPEPPLPAAAGAPGRRVLRCLAAHRRRNRAGAATDRARRGADRPRWRPLSAHRRQLPAARRFRLLRSRCLPPRRPGVRGSGWLPAR
jgi:HEAT repeat protein